MAGAPPGLQNRCDPGPGSGGFDSRPPPPTTGQMNHVPQRTTRCRGYWLEGCGYAGQTFTPTEGASVDGQQLPSAAVELSGRATSSPAWEPSARSSSATRSARGPLVPWGRMSTMGGLVKRAAAITGRFANSGAVAPGVAAACELLAMSAHMPPEVGKALGVAIGSAVGSVAEEMVDVGAKAWQYRIDNVERFADGVHASGMTLDKLITDAAENPKRLEVLIRVIEAAARSLDATKVTMLARLYAQTAHDDDQIDDVALLEEAIRHLERPHLRLMRALSAEPPGPPDTGVASRTPMAGWAEGDFLATHSSLLTFSGQGHSCVHIAGLGDFRLLLVVGW